MINRVVLVGRLTRDPNELRSSANGTKLISFTIAVDKYSSRSDDGNSADYISCVAFNKNAEVVDMYFKKGMLVGIEGRLSSRSYDKDGVTRYVTEVTCDYVRMLESKAVSASRSEANSYSDDSETYVETPKERTIDLGIDEDDLPF